MSSRHAVRDVVAGSGSGPALVLDEPLSLWGGLDPETGLIIDVRHPQHGSCVSGAVVFLPSGRGSSSASSVLVESVRLGTAPAALVLKEADDIIALGSLVGSELYNTTIPVVVAESAAIADIQTGNLVHVEPGGLRS